MIRVTPEQAIESALTARKLSVPASFVPKDGPIHANIQRAFAADLRKDGNLKGSFQNAELWSYEPMLGAVTGKDRKWLFLGHADGGNYQVGVWDPGAPNPAVYVADSDHWDEEADIPRSATRLAPRLSDFIKKLRPELPPSKKKSGDEGVFAEPIVIEGDHRILACAGHRVLVERGGEVVMLQVSETGVAQSVVGPVRGGIAVRYVIDDHNVIACWSNEVPVERHHIAFSRYEAGTWSGWQVVEVEEGPPAPLRAFAVGGDHLVLGWAPDHDGRWPGTLQTYRFAEGTWVADARMEVPADQETWFGASAAVFASPEDGGDVLLAAASWNGVRVYAREGDQWEEIAWLRAPDNEQVTAVDLNEELVVLGCSKSRSHVDELGWTTGYERTGSGALVVYERTDPGYGSAQVLKGSDGKQYGGVEFENLGSEVVAGDGWVLGRSWQRKANKPSFTSFARAGGRWVQRCREIELVTSDESRAYGSGVFVQMRPAKEHQPTGPLHLRRVLLSMADASPTKAPRVAEPLRVAVEGSAAPKELRQMGQDLALLPGGRVATLICDLKSGDALGLVDADGTLKRVPITAFEPDLRARPRLVACGDSAVVQRKSELYVLNDRALDRREAQVGDDDVVFGGAFGLLAVNRSGSLARFSPSLELMGTGTLEGRLEVEWVAGEAERLVLGAPKNNKVVVLGPKLELIAELKPKKATKRLGGGVAVDGDALLVGSGAGVHVFERDGDSYVEIALIKVTRGKKYESSFVRVHGDVMVVGSRAMHAELGAIVVFGRDKKKKWKPRLELSDCSASANALIDEGRLIVGRPGRRAPLSIYTL